MPQDYDLNIDGVTYNLHWDKAQPPTQADVQSVVNTARGNPAHQIAAFVQPKDPNTEQALVEYSQKFLQPGHVPFQIAHQIATLPPNARYDAIPAGLSEVGKLAVLRQAWQLSGAGNGSIGPQAAPKPNAFQQGLQTVGNVLSTPAAMVKAGLQPLQNMLLQQPEADAAISGLAHQKGVSASDLAASQTEANLPYWQRVEAVRNQPLNALGQPQKAAQEEAQYQTLPPIEKALYAGGELGSQLAADPLTYALAGSASALENLPAVGRTVSGAFAAQQALPLLANPQQIVADPYRSLPQLLMAGLAGAHAVKGSPVAAASPEITPDQITALQSALDVDPNAPTAPASAPTPAPGIPLPKPGFEWEPLASPEIAPLPTMQEHAAANGPNVPGNETQMSQPAPPAVEPPPQAPQTSGLPQGSAVRVAQGFAFVPDGAGGETPIPLPKNPTQRTQAIRDLQAVHDAPATEQNSPSPPVQASEPTNTPPFQYQPQEIGTAYHGTSKPIERVGQTFDRYQGQNLYGPGFYTTDNADIAGSYTKKGGGQQPNVYRVEWTGDHTPRFLDLEQPLPPELHGDFQPQSDYPIDQEVFGDLDLSKPAKAVYQEIRERLRDAGATRDQAEETLHDLTYRLQDAGFDGFSHIGGGIKGNVPHNVKIFFDPAENVRIAPKDAPEQPAPNIVTGAAGQTFTPDNTPVPFRYGVVPADSLITSHTDNFGENAAYDQNLQPRDRTRNASVSQIADIATHLQPERLTGAPTTADGAPLIGPDLQVESGNGRTLAIRRNYAQGDPAGYQQHLIENAAQFGLAAPDVAKIQNPVLVRVSDLNHATPEARSAFATEAGKSPVAAMSAPETAVNDGRMLRQSGLISQVHDPNPAALVNRPFVQQFIAGLGANERAGLIQPDGALSIEGIRRIRNAVTAAAYEDPQLISRLSEDPDNHIRAVGTALETAAPRFAAIKQGIEAGTHYDLDLSPDIAEAAKTLTYLRDKNIPVDRHLAQEKLFEESNPVADHLLRIFEANKRSGKAITQVLNAYADSVEALGNPQQESLFGEFATPTKLDALANAEAVLEREKHGLFANEPDAGRGPAGSVYSGGSDQQPAAETTNPLAPADLAEAGNRFSPAGRGEQPAAGSAESDAAGKPGSPGQTEQGAGGRAGQEVVPKPAAVTFTRSEADEISNQLAVSHPGVARAFDTLLSELPKSKSITLQTTPEALQRVRRALDATQSSKFFNPKTVRAKIDQALKDAQVATQGDLPLHAGVPVEPLLSAVFGKERVAGAKAAAVALKDSVRTLFDPTNGNPVAHQTANAGRDYLAQLAQRYERARAALAPIAAKFDTLPQAEKYAFIDAIENGGKQPTPELQAVADTLRTALDKTRDEIRSLGTGALDTFIDDYFPHLWKDPQGASQAFAGRSPLEGPKSFLKQRTLPTFADGIAAGLEPVTDNPIELAQLKLHEMNRYLFAQKWFQEMKAKGIIQYAPGMKAPDGYAPINDSIGQVWERQQTFKADGSPGAPQFVKRGQWVAPTDAARIVNNHLSPGLGRSALYRAALGVNNALNMAQLGLSGFHVTGTAINSIVSEVGRAIQFTSRGQIGRALITGAKAPIAPLLKYLEGSKVLSEYMQPGAQGGDIPGLVEAVTQAGGRASLDPVFRLNSLERFQQNLRRGDLRGTALETLPAALEATMAPVMRHFVPRLKLGVFADMARDALERLPQGATLDQRRAALADVWDSVDNRFGQLVYDNLFWERTLKDSGHLAVRSLGWNLGTIRELGGGLVDAATTGSRLQAGGPLVTNKLAYTVALPLSVGVMGAMYQYLHTGQGPETLEDYFHPRTGNGNERVNLPTYMRDVQGYATDPLKTLSHKQSPLTQMMAEMAQNKDYYEQPIRNVNDPAVKQAQEYFHYLGGQLLPFTFRPPKKGTPPLSPERQGEQLFGVTPYYPPKRQQKPSGYR